MPTAEQDTRYNRKDSVSENHATQQLAELISRIAKLTSENLEPPQFFASYLQLAVAATGSHGGAIWLTQAGQPPQCYCHIELESTQINDSEEQKKLLVDALQKCADQEQVLILPQHGATLQEGQPPSSNCCPYPLIFKPLRAANQVSMVMQLIGKNGMEPQQFQFVLGLLNQVAEYAETYLAHRRAAVLDDDRKSLAKLLKYTEGVHESLNPTEVVYQLANLGRDTIGCERVVVWVDPNIKRGVHAVSGVDKPDKRAVLLQAIEKLSQHCLEINKPIISSREQLVELPEEERLTQLLKNYFNISQLDQIYIQAMPTKKSDIGTIVAEGFDEQSGINLAGVMSTVCTHGGIALNNAIEMASVPLVKPFAKLQNVKNDPVKKKKWMVRTGIIFTLLLILAFMPWTIKIDCVCELTPKVSRVVDAPLDGIELARISIDEGVVQPGDIIAELDDTELVTKLISLQARYDQQEIKDSLARGPEKRISGLELKRIQQEIALVKEQIEKCKIRSPIAGTILTPRNELKLLEGITVKKGDKICEVAAFDQWELVLDLPQEELAWVQRGLEENSPSKIKYFLAAYPKDKLETVIADTSQISQMAVMKDKGNVFQVRVPLDAKQLSETFQNGLRPGSEGQAKIETVSRPLGYVLLRKVIRFFRVTFF